MESSKKLTLLSEDKVPFEFNEEVTKLLAVESVGVKLLLFYQDKDSEVPVGSRALKMVIMYCLHQARLRKKEEDELEEKALFGSVQDEDVRKEYQKKLNDLVFKEAEVEDAIVDDRVSELIQEILGLGTGMIFEVIKAANDLKVFSLLDLVCPFMLDKVRCKEETQIYETLNMKMKYTDEEIQEIIKENNSMFLRPDDGMAEEIQEIIKEIRLDVSSSG